MFEKNGYSGKEKREKKTKKQVTFTLGIGFILLSVLMFFVYGTSQKTRVGEIERSGAVAGKISGVGSEMELNNKLEKESEMLYLKELEKQNKIGEESEEPLKVAIQTEKAKVEIKKSDLEVKKEELEKEREKIVVVIPVNTSAKKSVEILNEKGIIKDSETFIEFVKYNNKTKKIRSGIFEFPPEAGYEEILKILCRE